MLLAEMSCAVSSLAHVCCKGGEGRRCALESAPSERDGDAASVKFGVEVIVGGLPRLGVPGVEAGVGSFEGAGVVVVTEMGESTLGLPRLGVPGVEAGVGSFEGAGVVFVTEMGESTLVSSLVVGEAG